MFCVLCLGIWWRHDIWISKMLEVDYLKNKKSFRSEIKSIFFLVSQVLSFRHTKRTSKNVADTTFKCGNNQFSWDSGVDLNSSSSSESQVEPCRLPRESFSHKLYFIFNLSLTKTAFFYIYIIFYLTKATKYIFEFAR